MLYASETIIRGSVSLLNISLEVFQNSSELIINTGHRRPSFRGLGGAQFNSYEWPWNRWKKIQDWWKYFYFKLLNQIPFWGTLNITFRNMCSHHLMKFLIIMHVHTDKNRTDFSLWNKHVSIMTLFD